MKVKIIGAGSIGNHLAQASRRMGWEVTVVDRQREALERMRNDIYVSRYGKWDESIELYEAGKEPKGGFDIIFIGTPPDSHIGLALECLEEQPLILHIEKPLCPPSMEKLKEMKEKIVELGNKTTVTIGFDHVVAESIEFVRDILKEKKIGKVITMDVEFREHWQGIFKAHPWLTGPQDTYLGFTEKGGGASNEHSHALNLWQYFARILGWGRVAEVSALVEIVEKPEYKYDSLCSMHLRTEGGNAGRVIQDVITLPTRKWLRIQGEAGFIEWYCNGCLGGDLIKYRFGNEGDVAERTFNKKRPDDFYRLTMHYQNLLDKKINFIDSPLNIERGIETVAVIAKALQSSLEKKVLEITY